MKRAKKRPEGEEATLPGACRLITDWMDLSWPAIWAKWGRGEKLDKKIETAMARLRRHAAHGD